MVCNKWSFDTYGSSLDLEDGFKFRIAGFTSYSGSSIATSTFVSRNSWTNHPTWWQWGYGILSSLIDNGTILKTGTIGFVYDEDSESAGWSFARLENYANQVNYNLGKTMYPFNVAYINKIISGSYSYKLTLDSLVIDHQKVYIDHIVNPAGYIGISDHKFEYGYINTIYYATLNQNSSKDIKHNIKPIESVGGKIDKLEPVTFVYDSDPGERTRMGLIYEDTVEVMPEICTNNEGNKAINYVELIPALLKEIQDLRSRVKTLEDKLNERGDT